MTSDVRAPGSSLAAPPDLPRTVGDYRLEHIIEAVPEVLTVYDASVVSTGERVAVRMLEIPPGSAGSRLLGAAEARVLMAHPGLVRAHAALERNGQLYLVTEPSSSPTLASRLERGPLGRRPRYGLSGK